MIEKDQKELSRLVELDYARTADFITGLMQRQVGMRGLAVTIWAAVLGFAFDHSTWELGVLAIASVLVFLFLDGYYSLLYIEARSHASELESISAFYYRSLIRDDDQDSNRDLQVQLEAYRFGLYRSLKPFRIQDLIKVRQRVMFRYFYPFLALGGILATILIAVRHTK
jgi:hypothetical protein